MAIFGIEGGIGTGKTLTCVTLAITDLLEGKKLYSNIRFKHITPNKRKDITYLDKPTIKRIFEAVKLKKIDMRNSTVVIQEMHNYLDSRNSMSETNKTLSYFILTSRHTSGESMDIIYDTQDIGQVDLRLRRNTDYIIRPMITEWEVVGFDKTKQKEKFAPSLVTLYITAKIGHGVRHLTKTIDVTKTRDMFDTHEVVEW